MHFFLLMIYLNFVIHITKSNHSFFMLILYTLFLNWLFFQIFETKMYTEHFPLSIEGILIPINILIIYKYKVHLPFSLKGHLQLKQDVMMWQQWRSELELNVDRYGTHHLLRLSHHYASTCSENTVE